MENRFTFISVIRATRPGFMEEMLPEEIAAMQAHAEYLDRAASERKFFLVGPCTDRAFGISIFEAESLEVAQQIAENDPAVQRGVMKFEVHPFRISFWQSPEV